MNKISLFYRIRLKQALFYLIVPFLSVLITLSVTTDLFRTNKSAQAAFLINAASGIDYIPAGAEGQDVIIAGVTIYADKVKVRQFDDISLRVECTGASNPNCDSKRKFRSLTIRNGGVLTHEAVTTGDMAYGANGDVNGNGTLVDDTTGTARWKKVDIELTDGDLTIRTGGKIDVDGKGYPGGTSAYINGYGPGGGVGVVINSQGKIGSTGGSHGGVAGYGYCDSNNNSDCAPNYTEASSVIPSARYGIDSNEFDFGSGSGFGEENKSLGTHQAGSASGGGRIRINVLGHKVTMDGGSSKGEITANGTDGGINCEICANEVAISGGGAGGTIIINAASLELPQSDSENSVRNLSVSGGKNFLHTVSGESSIQVAYGSDGFYLGPEVGAITSIYADGGDSWYDDSPVTAFAGGGSGGVIKLVISGSNFNILKNLEAYKRNAALDSTYNPYSLQLGDEIKVNLKVSNLTINQLTVVEDYALQTRGSNIVVCEPESGSANQSGSVASDKVTWSITPSASEVDLFYYCVVK